MFQNNVIIIYNNICWRLTVFVLFLKSIAHKADTIIVIDMSRPRLIDVYNIIILLAEGWKSFSAAIFDHKGWRW